MSGPITLHPAGMAHLDILAALHEAGFPIGERWDVEAFRALMAMNGTQVTMACCGSVPVGFLMARLCLDEAEILTLTVHPDARRKGIARHLLDACIRTLKEQDAASLFLEVSVNNRPACSLYERAGFMSCGIRRHYYPDGSDARLLRYDLLTIIR